MKKLGLIFVVFLCFSLFLVPNKSSAQGTCPANTIYDSAAEECIPKCAAGQYYSYGTKKCTNYTCPKGEHMHSSPLGGTDRCVKNLTAAQEAYIIAELKKSDAASAAAKTATVDAGNVGLQPSIVNTKIAEVESKLRGLTSSVNNGFQLNYIQKLLAIKLTAMSSPKAGITSNAMILDILNSFNSYLDQEFKSTVSNEIKSKLIEADMDLIMGLINQARTQVEVDAGRMTADAKARSDALVNARSDKLSGASVAAATGVYTKNECSFGFGGIGMNLTACITEGVAWIIKSVFLNIAGFLLWLSANMINYAIQVGILDFKSWAPDALYPIWIVVRQIVSLFVVFAGLWLGLMYIIGKDETFEKYIPWVVIFALFVNFSYPLVRTAVDISNVVSLNIYASAVGNDALSGTGNNTAGSLIMSRLGLGGLIMSATTDSKKDLTNLDSSMVTKINSVPGAIMAVVFVLYAAYIFFMITGIIIMRTIALVFLIIASPILFIDSVIPKLGDEAVKLRKIFFEQLAVGPVFMIMLALTLKFIGIFSGVAKSGGAGTSQTVVEFFNIAMMLIMLHVMLKITKETAGGIGQMATNAMGKVGGFAGGVALGGVGMLGRAGIGRVAAKVRDSSWMTNQAGKDGVGGFVGRHAYNMSNSVANSSFDARNSSYVQAGATKLGIGVGMGSTMSYEKAKNEKKRKIDARVQDRKERYNNIKTTNEDDSTNYDGAKSRQEFFAGGNDKDKVAMFKSDKEEAEKENRERNAEVAVKADTYKALSGDNKKEYFANQTSSTQTKLVDNDMELAEKMNKERNEKQEERDRAAAAIDASNKARQEQTKAMVDAMKSQQAGTQTQPPAGYTPPKVVAMTPAAEKMKNDSTSTSQSNTHDINAPLEFA